MSATATSSPQPGASPTFAALLLGVALGGFFDGILLHQVLQWHHLLSLVPGEALRDPRVQILADGAFHVAMYAVALTGAVLLWRAQPRLAQAAAGSRLLGDLALGFAAWQFIDVVLFHWVAGIHRVRVDVSNPLAWDLGWLAVLGLVPLIVGAALRRRASRIDASRSRGGSSGGLAAIVGATVLATGAVAAIPPSAETVVVLFRPGVVAADAFAAAGAVGRIRWAAPSGDLVAIAPDPGANLWRLYLDGALLVSNAGGLTGCLAATRIASN